MILRGTRYGTDCKEIWRKLGCDARKDQKRRKAHPQRKSPRRSDCHGGLGDGRHDGRSDCARGAGGGYAVSIRARNGHAHDDGRAGLYRAAHDGVSLHGTACDLAHGRNGRDENGQCAHEGAHHRHRAGARPRGAGQGKYRRDRRIPRNRPCGQSRDARARRVGYLRRRDCGRDRRGYVRNLHGRRRHLLRRPAHRAGGAPYARDHLQ